jgi:hypothetical protein
MARSASGLASVLAGVLRCSVCADPLPCRWQPGQGPVQCRFNSLPFHVLCLAPAGAHCRCPALRGTRIEELRRRCWIWRSYGYELVMPPLLEHLESLLTGTGSDSIKTFKLVDQLRPHAGPARRHHAAGGPHRRPPAQPRGVTRLCYCGPVLHTRPDGPRHARAAAVRRRDLRPRRPGSRPGSAGLALDA